MTRQNPVLKADLSRRLTLITALIGILIVGILAVWQLRPRYVEDAIGPIPLGFGDPASPKKLVAFLSPTCPHCARFELQSGKDFYALAEAGEFYYAVYPLMLEEDREIYTLGFFCAYEQGNLPLYTLLHYRNLYLNTNLGLRELAQRADMDPAVFSRCLSAPATTRALEDALRWRTTLDVPATPTFFLKTSDRSDYRRVQGNQGQKFWERWLTSN